MLVVPAFFGKVYRYIMRERIVYTLETHPCFLLEIFFVVVLIRK